MSSENSSAVLHANDVTARRHQVLEAAASSLAMVDSDVSEIETLLSRLSERVKSPLITGLPTMVRNLRREQDAMRRLATELQGIDFDGQHPDAEGGDSSEARIRKLANRLEASCTTISHACLQWSVLKRCRSLVAINQTFQASTKETRRAAISSSCSSGSESTRLGDATGRDKALLHRALKEKGRVELDVVEGGAEWIDIRSTSVDRLARQMTDAGWGWGDHELGDVVDQDEWEGVLLAKQIRRSVEAARQNRHEYRFPTVRIILPKIRRGANIDLDVFLEQLPRIDPLIDIVIEDASSQFLAHSPPPMEEAIQNLLGDELAALTPTINMDHTILIDLISDITHAKLEARSWQARTTQAQIEEENGHEGGVMARTLYPVLRGRKLVCTKEAAEHFHEVLDTVGTNTERRRGHLLVPNPSLFPPSSADSPRLSDSQIHSDFCSLSIHPPPPDVQIPVTVLPGPTDFTSAVEDGRLPKVALDVARCGGFKSSKLSIYMHGWIENIVTVTSNKEIRGQIRTWVEANRHGDENAAGPRIYRLDVTRNLLAKSATPPDGWEDGQSQ